jgi:hypothetical protein
MVVDGDEGPAYRDCHTPRFSPDGAHVAYVAWHDESNAVVVVDGVEGTRYGDIDGASLVYSPDGRHLAFQAKLRDDRWALVVDDTIAWDNGSFVKGSSLVFDSSTMLRSLALRGRETLLIEVLLRTTTVTAPARELVKKRSPRV